ncbi:MAG: hypothetical protein II961_08150 [Candidatus Riflebacteria bacterium]|nr:hypothetical protein [Candidatus Riflebacteria bacterium]
MGKINNTTLTEEELENFSGGRNYIYELVHGPKGDYYRCTSGYRTISVGVDRWVEWLKILAERGDTIQAKE